MNESSLRICVNSAVRSSSFGSVDPVKQGRLINARYQLPRSGRPVVILGPSLEA